MNAVPDKVPPMLPYTGIPGIESFELDPRAGALHVSISRERPPLPTNAIEAEWAKLTAANHRMYDGPVLAVLGFDQECNQVLARRDSFKRLAVQPRVHTGVRLLAVTALLEAVDEMGRRYALLGRRAQQTRIFGGMWEIGPSGGVSVPPANVDRLSLDDLCLSLHEEISEEIGLTVPRQGEPLAYVRDLVAHSDDILIRFSLGKLGDVADLARPANWEYEQTLWMPIDCASQFDTEETIAATRALFRTLGWLPMH